MRINPLARLPAPKEAPGAPTPAEGALARDARPAAPHQPSLPALIAQLLAAPDPEEVVPPLVAGYLGCRRLLLYLVRDEALHLVGGTADATTQGYSSTLIRIAAINPIALDDPDAPEARALRGDQPLWQPEAADLPARMLMPLIGPGGPVGVLVVIPAEGEAAWGADGLRPSHTFALGLHDVARIVALILQSRALVGENQRRAGEIGLLTRLTTAFNSSVLDLEAAILIVEKQISQITQASQVAVALGPFSGPGATPLRWLRLDLVRAVLQLRQPLLLDDIQHWPYAHLVPEGMASFYAFQLVAEDRPVGLLAIGFRQPHTLSESEHDLIAILVNTASAVLQKSRLHAEAERARQQSRDLLERVQREERLKDAILRSIQSGLIAVDLAGRVMHVNPQAQAILAITEKAALGRPVEEVLPVTHPSPAAIRAALGPRMSPRRGEVRARHPAGHELTLALTITPLTQGDGKDLGAICAFQDVTEMRALQEQTRLLEASSQEISHDMRNVVASMLSGLELMRPTLEGDTETRVVLNRIFKDTARLKSLAENILNYGQPKAPQPAVCDAAALIEVILRVTAPAAAVHHVAIERHFEPGARLLVDEHQLLRVLENLCSNAIEAMPKGGTLRLATRTTRASLPPEAPPPVALGPSAAPTDLLLKDRRGRAIEISIADTGVGIPAERLDEIWEPFKTFGKRSGHGLGLAIARQIVEAHGGTITVASEVGQGTTFTLRLPAA